MFIQTISSNEAAKLGFAALVYPLDESFDGFAYTANGINATGCQPNYTSLEFDVSVVLEPGMLTGITTDVSISVFEEQVLFGIPNFPPSVRLSTDVGLILNN